jgi:hypothetical protein
MTRTVIDVPRNQDDWNNLPKEFTDYLDALDEVKQNKAKSIPVDPLYPYYDYQWEFDSEIPFMTVLSYWNAVDKELPDSDKLVDEINEGLGEAAYDDHVSSFYSY